MKDELAERALASVMGWEPEELVRVGSDLQAMATHKYDSYEGYAPGEKFLESLTGWLWQFDEKHRDRMVRFVRDELIFISEPEIQHIIELVYPDLIRPLLIGKAAQRLDCSPMLVRKVAAHQVFRELQRKTLVLALSDGARLDYLRRSCDQLSHEQFHLAPELGLDTMKGMGASLREALAKLGLPEPAQFEEVLLVEDFAGTGATLLRRQDDAWKGKLVKAGSHLRNLHEQGLVAQPEVTVLLYMASERAHDNLRRNLRDAELNWQVKVVQLLPDEARVVDDDIRELCEWFFDDVLRDEHKAVLDPAGEGRAPMGFAGAALPLVLHHNAPNNSISVLWADTSQVPDSLERRALFPRYERHHSDRP